MKKINSFQQSGERYGILRVIAVLSIQFGAILMEIGAVLLALGLYALVWGAPAAPPRGGGPVMGTSPNVLPFIPWLPATMALFWSAGLLLFGLQLIATGTVFRLLIHLEENTRATAQSLDRIRSRLESSPEGVQPWFPS